MTDAPAFNVEEDYDWLGLVAASGLEGERWAASYRILRGNTVDDLRQSLQALRQRRIDEGYRLLTRAFAAWQPLAAVKPDVYWVVGRFFWGTLAYYYYCNDDFAGADQALGTAGRSIRMAVEQSFYLLPFAVVLVDINLKQAQTARVRWDWTTMKERLSSVEEIMTDRKPLLVLNDGTAVFHHTIGQSFDPCSLPPRLANAARYLFDESLRLQCFERSRDSLYALPDLLLPFP